MSLLLAAGLTVFAAAPPNLDKAIAAQRQLVAASPDDPGVHNDFGNLLALSRNWEEAEAAYRRALELDPSRPSTHFNLGLLFQSQGRAREAHEEFQAVLELAPTHAWSHYQIGTLLAGQGHREAAVEAYAEAISLDPDLAFPDVNPHVIENDLFTEALLAANRRRRSLPLAPRSYEDPSRIADILVPPRPPEDVEEAGEEPAAGSQGVEEDEEEAPVVSSRPGTADPVSHPSEPDTPARRALDRDDLGGRRVNQARPQGGQPSPRRGGFRPPVTPRGGSTVPRPQSRPQPPGRLQPSVQTPGNQPPPDRSRPFVDRYQPGRSSSARLELKLFQTPGSSL